MKNIRNFCIIAHINHGKSTIADRILEYTKTIPKKNKAQILDNMDLERERGITIKSHAVQMRYSLSGKEYIINLIDTPGHTDFSHEVSRAIISCEGAILIIDGSQGIQSQTMSNLYLALNQKLKIIPVINKIDLVNEKIENIKNEIIEILKCKKEDIILASAKNGIGIKEIIEKIIKKIPPPSGSINSPLEAIIFDSMYNPFKGVEIYFKVINGIIKKNEKIKFISTNKIYNVEEIGILKIKKQEKNYIESGNIGYLICKIKNTKDIKIGDTITHHERECKKIIKKIKNTKPMIFAGVYPINNDEYKNLKSAIEKLQLNDSSLVWEKEKSLALGFGFRCGFLGVLHMEIIQERLEREFKINIILTIPSIELRITNKKNEVKYIKSASEIPDNSRLYKIEEPIAEVKIKTKSIYIGKVINICMDNRGILKNQIYITKEEIKLTFEIPLNEIVFNFFDKIKNVTQGYSFIDYEIIKFEESKIVKLKILINGKNIDILSMITHKSKAYILGKKICGKLKKVLNKKMFEIGIQAAIENKIIVKEKINSINKNVISKCYGGDISRKKKLLQKQKEGKKRMKKVGNIEITQEAFLSIMKL